MWICGEFDVPEAIAEVTRWAASEIMEKQKDGRVRIEIDSGGSVIINEPDIQKQAGG